MAIILSGRLRGFLISATILLVFLAYKQVSTGSFLFDDFTNLESITKLNNIESFFRFILSGQAGPTGRPISLLTFIPFKEYWPYNPYPFILTNIVLHLVNGLLVYFLVVKLYRLQNKVVNLYAIAMLTSIFWLILPNHVSTVAYVIQRMTLLAATFSLLSLISMVVFLQRFKQSPNVTNKYWLISLSFLILAVLSKENAATISMVIYSLFFLLPKELQSKKSALWIQRVFGSIGALILVYMITIVFNADKAYSGRDFNLIERFLTEVYLMPTHFSNFIIPRPATNGLFNDQLQVISTSGQYSIAIGLLVAIVTSIIFAFKRLKTKQSILSFWLLFFFINHIIESTVVPLELYFEHRNYLPYLSFSAILAILLFDLGKRYRLLAILVGILFLAGNVSSLVLRTNLWGNPLKSAIYWAVGNQNSYRAQQHLAIVYSKLGLYTDAMLYLEQAYIAKPSEFIKLSQVNLSCRTGTPIVGRPLQLDNFKTSPYLKENYLVVLESINLSEKKACDYYNASTLIGIINRILENANYQSVLNQQQYIHMRAILNLQNRNITAAIQDFNSSLLIRPDINALMEQAGLIASNGYCEHAVRYLQQHKNISIKYSIRQQLIRWFYPQDKALSSYIEKVYEACHST